MELFVQPAGTIWALPAPPLTVASPAALRTTTAAAALSPVTAVALFWLSCLFFL